MKLKKLTENASSLSKSKIYTFNPGSNLIRPNNGIFTPTHGHSDKLATALLEIVSKPLESYENPQNYRRIISENFTLTIKAWLQEELKGNSNTLHRHNIVKSSIQCISGGN
jgi:hypothetical protein